MLQLLAEIGCFFQEYAHQFGVHPAAVIRCAVLGPVGAGLGLIVRHCGSAGCRRGGLGRDRFGHDEFGNQRRSGRACGVPEAKPPERLALGGCQRGDRVIGSHGIKHAQEQIRSCAQGRARVCR